MATYKGIQGYSVQTLTSDPTAADVEGQLWYNSGTGKFKISVASAGAWASSPAVNVARRSGAYAGTSTAAVMTGGIGSPNSPDPASSVATETYNGSSWTVAASNNTGVFYSTGVGTSTAALKIAGSNVSSVNHDSVESWDGTSWTETTALTSVRKMMGSAESGTTTAALVFGGATGPTAVIALTELFNGSTWTELADLNTARKQGYGAGISTAALYMGGGYPYIANTESWDGSSWAVENNVNTARQNPGAGGTQAAAVFFAGDTGSMNALTEIWDGTCWTEVADMATARQSVGGAGTAANGLCISGYNGAPNNVAVCEAWSDPVYTIKTVTVS